MKITEEIANRIIDLVKSKSISDVAKTIGCSYKAVCNTLKSRNVNRTAEEKFAIRSRVRTDLIRAERRRVIFGFDQKSNLKVFSNKERNRLKYCLRRKGYQFPERGKNVAYYNEETNRNPVYEERGRKLGIIFLPAVQPVLTEISV